MKLKNKYILLRHGKNIHQTKLKDIIYHFPDDNPPCQLIEEGIEEAKRAGEKIKEKNIDYIYCSDILRARQTAKIVADVIGFDSEKIIYDTRLRDINWGIFGGKHKDEAWAYYNCDMKRKINESTPQGETRNDCKKRMIDILQEIERNNENIYHPFFTIIPCFSLRSRNIKLFHFVSSIKSPCFIFVFPPKNTPINIS